MTQTTKSPSENKDPKKLELRNRQLLNECLNEITRDYPYNHSNSFDVWSNECIIENKNETGANLLFAETKPKILNISQVLTSANFTSLVECNQASTLPLIEHNSIYPIENPVEYQSPLRCFRGYRFSSHFSKFNNFEDAYSKFYCNLIDLRRPFCPFDLHGSCKDSNCIYQHLNVITMDNFQRTEHFFSYCPQVLSLSSEHPTQREAAKKLSNCD